MDIIDNYDLKRPLCDTDDNHCATDDNRSIPAQYPTIPPG